MIRVIQVVAAVLVGILLGLLYTIRSLDDTDQGVVAGPWHATPRDRANGVDPYALATIARAGLLPLGAAEGLTFLASTDSAGAPLSPDCDYVVSGQMPAARFWTLSLLDPHGFPDANPASRYGFTSGEVLRFNNGPAVIEVSSEARSGNWLPIGQAAPFLLMLRLYDTGLSTIGVTIDPIVMPSVEKTVCR